MQLRWNRSAPIFAGDSLLARVRTYCMRRSPPPSRASRFACRKAVSRGTPIWDPEPYWTRPSGESAACSWEIDSRDQWPMINPREPSTEDSSGLQYVCIMHAWRGRHLARGRASGDPNRMHPAAQDCKRPARGAGGAMISLPPTKPPAGDLPGGMCEESRWRASCAWPRAQAAHVKHVAITSICGS